MEPGIISEKTVQCILVKLLLMVPLIILVQTVQWLYLPGSTINILEVMVHGFQTITMQTGEKILPDIGMYVPMAPLL